MNKKRFLRALLKVFTLPVAVVVGFILKNNIQQKLPDTIILFIGLIILLFLYYLLEK